MNKLKSSIVWKLVIYLLLFVVVVSLPLAYFYKTGDGSLAINYIFAIIGVFVIYFLALYYFGVVRPLNAVLNEMQCLIAGKPYKKIFTTRIDEIGILAHFFNSVTKGFGEVSYDIKDRERMIDELKLAAQLQRDTLPLKSPGVKGLQLVAKNKPATELGGDIFNFVTSKSKTYIYIGDVTGHGVAAGLIMTMATSLINVFADIYGSAYEILVNVNRYIKRHVKKAMFLTMVMLSWDEEKGKLSFVGAGHEHILVYRMATGECEAIVSGGVALGMVPDNSKLIKEQELTVNEGDFVILYSDGIVEARNTSEELYGLERLKKSVIEYAPQYSAEGLNYHIAQDVSAFNHGHIQDDDMSLIVIKRDSSLTSATAIGEQTINWHG